MGKTAFETVCERILENEKITRFQIDSSQRNKLTMKSDDLTYEIMYDLEKTKIILKLISENSEKVLSYWLLDETHASKKDIEMISKDFSETIFGNDKITVKKPNKKNLKDLKDESHITGLFFANRMVNIFPELKTDIYIEKECYSEFRAATFTKTVILPKINNLLLEPKKNINTIKKLGKLLSDLYSNATLDVRSIITMAIFNNLNNSSVIDEFLSEELKKAKEHALKYKDKKVKPEKIKKKTTLLSKALEYQRQSENQK